MMHFVLGLRQPARRAKPVPGIAAPMCDVVFTSDAFLNGARDAPERTASRSSDDAQRELERPKEPTAEAWPMEKDSGVTEDLPPSQHQRYELRSQTVR